MLQKVRKVENKLSQMDQEISIQEGKLKSLTTDLAAEEVNRENVDKEYRSKKVALDLLPDYEANYKKLQNVVQNTKAKLLKLANEWERHRTGLLEDYRRKKRGLEDRKVGAK